MLAFALLTFIGTMAQHLTGSLLTTMLYSSVIMKKGVIAYWDIVFFLYPFERIMITATSTLIGVTVLKAIRKVGYAIPLTA